jgi:predicted HTH transcriptional regulator
VFDWDTLLNYIHAGNTANNRFITQVDSEGDLSPIIAAMANTTGGRIIIGMDIKNLHLIGTTVNETWVKSVVKKMCTPYIHLDIEEFVKNSKHIVCILVAEGQRKPYYYKKECYITDKGPSIRVASDDEINDMKRETAALQQFLDAESEERAIQEVESVSLTPPPFNPNSYSEAPEKREDLEDFDSITDDMMDIQTNNFFEEQHNQDSNNQNQRQLEETPQQIVSMATEERERESEPKAQSDRGLFPLNTRQLKAVRFLKIGNPDMNRIQNKKYRNLYSVSHKTAHIELVDLVSRGILEQEGSGRSTCYRLSEAVLVVNSNTHR